MNKTSGLLFLLFGTIAFILVVIFSFVYDKRQLVFCAKVMEVYPSSAIVIPDSDFPYDRLSVNIINVQVGDYIRIYAKNEIKETYPPIAEVTRYEACIK